MTIFAKLDVVMTFISAVHVRTFARMFPGTPEMLAQIFRGSGVAIEDIDDPEFVLPLQSFWTIFDNVVEMFGQDWFLNFPILWSPELQTEVGLAMRMSSNLGEALDLVTSYWVPRWPIGEIAMVRTASDLHVNLSPTTKMKEETWGVALSILSLNFATMRAAVIEQGRHSQRIRYEFGFRRPPYAERVEAIIDGDVSWEHPHSRLIIPNDMLKARSLLANPKQLAIMLEAIRKADEQVEAMATGKSVSEDVLSLLEAVEQGQLSSEHVAKELGLSKRSLERRLMGEGTSFREVATESLKKRLATLLRAPGSNAETIAFQLGYHDGSSVMRACKRWFGKPLSEVRAELRASSA